MVSVIPAQPGIHCSDAREADKWIPACAGMTAEVNRRIFRGANRLREEEPLMSVQDVGFDRAVNWPSNALSEVPFRVYTDPEQYRLEQERIFRGPTWSYLCLASEIAERGDWVATTIGEVAVIVARGLEGRSPQIIGRSTQVLPNNWKLYFENTKDTYHASILHTFLNTFRINRMSQPGGINIADNGGNHFSYAKLDYAAEDEDYKREALRASNDLHLEDRSILDSVDEYGDQISVQILTIFPGMVLQQIRNT